MPLGMMPRPQMDHMMGPNRMHPLQHMNNMMPPPPGAHPLQHDGSENNQHNNNKRPLNYQNKQKVVV